MAKYGYFHKHIVEKENRDIQAMLKNAGCQKIVCEEDINANGTAQYAKLTELIHEMKQGDTLVTTDAVELRKTVIQISALIDELDRNGLEFDILNRGAEISMPEYKRLVHSLANMEKDLIRNRTSRGLKRARSEGRVGGRPRVSQETIDRIQFLYNTDKYSLREIADQCGISLGTAYKYVQLRHHQ